MENLIPEESEMGNHYEMQRNPLEELNWASLQRGLALSDLSTCRESEWGSFTGGCTVYHSFFPTAEQLDMVSSPRHHPELFLDSLSKLVETDTPKVWIPASATPRTYDMVRFVKPMSVILATDICATPVVTLPHIYPEDSFHKLLLGGKLNIFDTQFSGLFDAVVTDAFLTRFTGADKGKVLKILYNSLKPGAALLTTIRIPASEEHEIGQLAEKRGEEASGFVDKVVEAYNKLLAKVGAGAERPYKDEIDLRSDASAYQRTMKSSHAREDKDLLIGALMPKLGEVPNMRGISQLLLEAGFESISMRISKPVYDLTTRRYLQVAAIK